MSKDIFCQIVAGEIPSVKIWEDELFLAILDINPNTPGVTLVIPKTHYQSDPTDMPDEIFTQLMLATKKVVKILEKGLGVLRVAIVVEGMGINHVHVKLYPLHGLSEKFTETWAPEEVFFEKYEGYISTQLGPQQNQESLKAIADKIIKANQE